MRKLLFFVTTGMIAVWMAGCQGDSGSNQASPNPSPSTPSPTAKANPSASPSASPSPFSSPIVTASPNSTGASVPGLIPATNPDDRATKINTAPLPPPKAAPLTAQAQPGAGDPFGPLPPQPVQGSPAPIGSGNGQTKAPPGTVLPKLAERQVPVLPTLPASSRPPQLAGGAKAGNPDLPLTNNSRQIASLPPVPELNPPALGNRPARNLSLPNGGQAPGIGTAPQVPGINPPQLGRRTAAGAGRAAGRIFLPRFAPSTAAGRNPVVAASPGTPRRRRAVIAAPPSLPVAVTPQGVPQLPVLPVEKRPPQWRNPIRPQAAPNSTPVTVTGRPARKPPIIVVAPPALPVAAKPLGVPELPKLPVDKRPPQWVDPNPRPVASGPAAPPPPSTDIARGIEVSGVVKVGNEIQVIVKVPTEPTSRYVKVGQKLANGQVLIKRVEIKPGADPVIVLEQNGVEVAKGVGEKSNPDQKAGNTIASVPGTTQR